MSNRNFYQETFSQVRGTGEIRWEDYEMRRRGKSLRWLVTLAASVALLAALSALAVRWVQPGVEALAERTAEVVDRAHALAGELRGVEERLASTTKLMGAVVDYAKTRPVFDGYKAARYSKKYLAEHEEALASYRAAKAAINDILDGAKLPRMDALKKERRELAERKKKLYAQYRAAQQEMREAVAVKANVDHLLGLSDGRESKAQER